MCIDFERKLRAGRGEGCDLRIAGHVDHPLSRFTCPPLTTTAQDYRQIAQLGLDMLFSRIAVEKEIRLLDSHLIVRGSA